MKVGLLDVNMLIALAWPSHVHHRMAHLWFGGSASNGWATCPLTQCAFVRISSNEKIIPQAVSPKVALALLGEIIGQRHHVFWPDDIGLPDKHVPSDLLVGHRQVTDAYLLGLAIRHGGRLITLDAGVSALLPTQSQHRDSLHIVHARQMTRGAE
ncbi:MAG: VapC toxin family PIN domain ribonuclease [Lentisphaerae bacterium]|nr:VapC toxin family PIN domain ribonuclease [Lentisphaerota bacterium]